MILTVTPNTTVDQTLILPAFEFNRTIRATSVTYSMGGKPTDASFILGTLGIPSYAIGLAAGAMGEKVKTLLNGRGVITDFIPVGGETRLNTILAYPGGQTTITTNTLEVTPEHIDLLKNLYADLLPRASVVVMGGTLPVGVDPSLYADLIALARARSLPVIFDADQPNLGAGLAARPTIIKPNQFELERLTGEPIPDMAAAYQAGRRILAEYGTIPVITLAEQGGLAVLPGDRAYFIPPLPIDVVSAGGAGDGVLAGMAASFARRQPLEDGLRLGFACAAAVCLLPGTADCRPEDVERFLPLIDLRPYP
ncbi:MAG: hexose kinase [bacterium]|nr:hexose kinase [bacterium]